MDRNGAPGEDGTPYDGGMEARLAKLESDLSVVKTDIKAMRTDIDVMKTDIDVMKTDIDVMKLDIAVLKTTSATKSDLAEFRGEMKAAIAEANARTIMWVVTAVFLAQLLPALLKLLEK